MTDELKTQDSCLPNTALHNVEVFGSILLLVGQGCLVHVLNVQSGDSLSSFKVFECQAVHGIASEQNEVEDGGSSSWTLFVWGGPLFRLIKLTVINNSILQSKIRAIGSVVSTTDWILDATFFHASERYPLTPCMQIALISANNVLIHVRFNGESDSSGLNNSLYEIQHVPCALKSILYSAHVVWLSHSHVLVASGTVFGEVLVWSCRLDQRLTTEMVTTHYVFASHEGSVFGIHISPEYSFSHFPIPFRALASCSDDRTIRIWDISNLDCKITLPDNDAINNPIERIRSTGFGPAKISSDNVERISPVAMGWGHVSRIWGVQFVQFPSTVKSPEVRVVSRGEDGTLQEWGMRVQSGTESGAKAQIGLKHINTFHLHSGKNIWSWSKSYNSKSFQIFTGGADGSLVSTELYPDPCVMDRTGHWPSEKIIKYQPSPELSHNKFRNARSLSDKIQRYSFVSPNEFVAISQNGCILLAVVNLDAEMDDPWAESKSEIPRRSPGMISWMKIGAFDDLISYSIIVSDVNLGISVFGGIDSVIRCYDHNRRKIYDLAKYTGKIFGLFILAGSAKEPGKCMLSYQDAICSILLTISGSRTAHILSILGSGTSLSLGRTYQLPMFDGFEITSAIYLSHRLCLLVGSRKGGYGFYDTTKTAQDFIRSMRVIRNYCQKDAITSIKYLSGSKTDSSIPVDYILTAARDGAVRIHTLTFQSQVQSSFPTMSSVHESAMPLGLRIEGITINPDNKDILAHGFRSKYFVVWNESTQTEILSVDCGGSHRTWSYAPPCLLTSESGIFLWTKASTLNCFSRLRLPSRTVQYGGHGREIKVVSISNPVDFGNFGKRRILATGAEDTTIRLFSLHEPLNGKSRNLLGTIRRHTTGIQHLQWSSCGTYLFSSGGVSEFFVFKMTRIPSFNLGVYCEASCPAPDTEDGFSTPDLRITSFDVLEIDSSMNLTSTGERRFLIAQGMSNGFIKIYLYSSLQNNGQFTPLFHAPYTTNTCITSLRFLPRSASLRLCASSTNGHVSLWDISSQLSQQSCFMRNGVLVMDTKSSSSASSSSMDLSKRAIYWAARKVVHQNSVKCVTSIALADVDTIVLSGGDDNSLGITRFTEVAWSTISSDMDSETGSLRSTTAVVSTLRVPKAHASAINALTVLPDSRSRSPERRTASSRHHHDMTILTSGNDQRLKKWRVHVDLTKSGVEGVEVNELANVHTAVADLSDMDSYLEADGTKKAIVVGVGMEIWTVE